MRRQRPRAEIKKQISTHSVFFEPPLGDDMVKYVRVFIISILLSFLMWACGSTSPVTSRYHSSRDIMEYETKPVPVDIDWGSGVGVQKRVEAEAYARCRGQGCKPSHITLVFRLTGRSSVNLDGRMIQFTAEGKEFRSAPDTQEGTRNPLETPPSIGVIAGIEVSFEEFRMIARAQEIEGTLGSSEFGINRERRAPFRALIMEIAGEDGAPEDVRS